MTADRSAYRTTVDATGDDAGNSGKVSVRRRPDGTITLGAANRRESATVWLTRQQATDIALALMNAAHASGDKLLPDQCDGRCSDGREVCVLWHGERLSASGDYSTPPEAQR